MAKKTVKTTIIYNKRTALIRPGVAIAKAVSSVYSTYAMYQSLKRFIQRAESCGVHVKEEPFVIDHELYIINNNETQDLSYLFPDRMVQIGVPKKRYEEVIHFVMTLFPEDSVLKVKFNSHYLKEARAVKAELARRFAKVDPDWKIILRYDTMYLFNKTKVGIVDCDG